jgi:hypothetical protein
MIRINGHLGATVLSAFPALAPRHHGAHTVLTGLLDRSALYGVLAEIEALGLDLLEIQKLAPDRHPEDSLAQFTRTPTKLRTAVRSVAAAAAAARRWVSANMVGITGSCHCTTPKESPHGDKDARPHRP